MKATQRLYRTADGEIVAEDDPRAAFVLVNTGHDVPSEYVDKVKAFLGDSDEKKSEAKPETKAAEPPPNKAVKATPNK